MLHLAGGINPDSGIQVATVFPDGTVKLYKALGKKDISRRYVSSRFFTNYGQAKLWADEWEESNRRMKAKEAE